MLRKEELEFLQKHTKLGPKPLLSLIDNPRDFNLVLQSVSKNTLNKKLIKENLAAFSLDFCIRYLFYRFNHSQKTLDIDVEQLSYIIDAIVEVIPEVQKNKFFRKLSGKLSESMGRYSLICSSIFREELKSAKLSHQSYIDFGRKCFENCGKNYLAKNFTKISDLLYQFNQRKDFV